MEISTDEKGKSPVRTEFELPAAAAGTTPQVACRPAASIAANEESKRLRMQDMTADRNSELAENAAIPSGEPTPAPGLWGSSSERSIMRSMTSQLRILEWIYSYLYEAVGNAYS